MNKLPTEFVEIEIDLDQDLIFELQKIADEQDKTVDEVCEHILKEAFKPNGHFWDRAHLKPCPFCGTQPDIEDHDTMYPNGSAWVEREDCITHYVNRNQAPPENWCYSIHCVEHAGGCGVEMSGNSKQEAIEKWNRRAPQKE